ELNPKWKAIYQDVCRQEGLPDFPVVVGDCRTLLADWSAKAPAGFAAADFICTDPPYNLNFKRTMCEPDAHTYRRTDYTGFSDEAADLSNSADYPAFLEGLGKVLGLLRKVIRPAGYMAVMVRNAYQDGRYRLVHAELAAAAEARGWVLKGEKV